MADSDAASVFSESSRADLHPAFPFVEADADVILRSADHVDFRVHRLFLSKAGGVFEGMFGLPQVMDPASQDGEFIDGMPVVEVSDNSGTLLAFLLYIYPREDPILDDLTEVSKVLIIADKYGIDFISSKARHLWTDMADKDPLKAYAIACLNEWSGLARDAAESSLKEPVWPLSPQSYPEFNAISGNTVLRLEQYHRACSAAARDLALQNKQRWHQVLEAEQCQHCGNQGKHNSSRTGQLQLRNWLDKYLKAVAERFAAQPAPSTALDERLIHRVIDEAYEGAHPCDLSSYTIETIKHFTEHFAHQLQVVLRDIDPVLDF